MSAAATAIRILVVDDHSVVRQGVAGLVGGQPDMSIVGQACNGREALQQFRAILPIGISDIFNGRVAPLCSWTR